MERRKKTNRMLITVSIIFFMSWAPLNIFNIVIDIFEPFQNNEEDTKVMLLVFACCHLSAMSSVCSNPIMYGFLNENFKQSLHTLMKKYSCIHNIVKRISNLVSMTWIELADITNETHNRKKEIFRYLKQITREVSNK